MSGPPSRATEKLDFRLGSLALAIHLLHTRGGWQQAAAAVIRPAPGRLPILPVVGCDGGGVEGNE